MYWIEHLQQAGVPCGRVNNIDDVFDMPQVRALGIVQSIRHPTAGRIKVPGISSINIVYNIHTRI